MQKVLVTFFRGLGVVAPVALTIWLILLVGFSNGGAVAPGAGGFTSRR